MINLKSVEFLKECEGLKLKPYVDDKGKITIGYGHNLTDNGITPKQAENMLLNDIRNAEDDVVANFKWVNNPEYPFEVYSMLVHLTFWIGINRLRQFKKMLKAMEEEDWTTAVREFKDSSLYREYTTRCDKIIKLLLAGLYD